jgi:predicted dehydrogenase
MSKVIGIGFVGAGGNTRLRHLPGFAEIEGVRLVSVANRSATSSREVAEEFKIEKSAKDWKGVVFDEEVDAICIGTWPYMHAEVTIAALNAGKHVLTEARMASDLAGARSMLQASKAHPNLIAQIVPSPFTLDLDSTVKRILDAGELGSIREVFIDHAMGACLDSKAPLTWRQDPQYSGINMLTLGIYHEVIQRWFADPMKVLSAQGAIYTEERVHWETGRPTLVKLPDALHIHGRMGRDAILNYHFSAVESGAGRNEIRIVGSAGALRINVATGEVYQSSGNREMHVEIPDSERRGWRVEADFIESIRSGKPVELTSFAEGVRYMEFTDAVHACIQEI